MSPANKVLNRHNHPRKGMAIRDSRTIVLSSWKVMTRMVMTKKRLQLYFDILWGFNHLHHLHFKRYITVLSNKTQCLPLTSRDAPMPARTVMTNY